MTEEKKIQLIERLARNASIGKIIVDNHGTMNFNDYMGQEGQQRKEYAVYEEVTEVQPEAAEPPQTMPVPKDAAMTQAVEKCFRFNSDFVIDTVRTVVKEFYSGAYADLALIEVTLFDHGLLKKRNSHTAFLKALVALDFIKIATEQELKGIMYAIADKNRRIPKEGYKDWHIDYTNEKTFCEKIGNKLGPTIPYCR